MRTKSFHTNSLICLAALAILSSACAGVAQAAILNGENGTLACSNNDLLQTSLMTQPTVANGLAYDADEGNFTGWGPTGGLPILNDGSAADVGYAGGASLGNETPDWIVWVLDTSVNTAGYDLTSIDVFHGWRDTGRLSDTYSVSFATVDAPDTFVTLHPSVSHTISGGYHYGRNSVIVEDSDGATGVKKVRMEWRDDLHGVSEIDIVGVPTIIPEPSTIVLLAMGLLGLAACGRRRTR